MLTDTEIITMIKHVKTPRNEAIIATLAESGVRIGEILNCKIGDVLFTNLDDSDIQYAVYAKRFGLVEIVKEAETGKINGTKGRTLM